MKGINKLNRAHTFSEKVTSFIVSWIVMFVAFGIIYSVNVTTFSVLFKGHSGNGASGTNYKALMIASVVSSVFVWLLYLTLSNNNNSLFKKYSKWAAVTFIIISGYMIINNYNMIDVSDVAKDNGCTSLEKQLDAARGAIAPIATNLGTGT